MTMRLVRLPDDSFDLDLVESIHRSGSNWTCVKLLTGSRDILIQMPYEVVMKAVEQASRA